MPYKKRSTVRSGRMRAKPRPKRQSFKAKGRSSRRGGR